MFRLRSIVAVSPVATVNQGAARRSTTCIQRLTGTNSTITCTDHTRNNLPHIPSNSLYHTLSQSIRSLSSSAHPISHHSHHSLLSTVFGTIRSASLFHSTSTVYHPAPPSHHRSYASTEPNPHWDQSRHLELVHLDDAWQSPRTDRVLIYLAVVWFAFSCAIWYHYAPHVTCSPSHCATRAKLDQLFVTGRQRLKAHVTSLVTYGFAHDDIRQLASNWSWIILFGTGIGWRYGPTRAIAIGAISSVLAGVGFAA